VRRSKRCRVASSPAFIELAGALILCPFAAHGPVRRHALTGGRRMDPLVTNPFAVLTFIAAPAILLGHGPGHLEPLRSGHRPAAGTGGGAGGEGVAGGFDAPAAAAVTLCESPGVAAGPGPDGVLPVAGGVRRGELHVSARGGVRHHAAGSAALRGHA